jgi:hypothetical protein
MLVFVGETMPFDGNGKKLKIDFQFLSHANLRNINESSLIFPILLTSVFDF